MGCRCANSHEEEYEINKREATKENMLNSNKEGNEFNNSNHHLSNNDFNSEKNNRTNFSPNINEGRYIQGNEESPNADMEQEKQEILKIL